MTPRDTPTLHGPLHAICFDWGGTLMTGSGPADLPMADWPEVNVLDGAVECLAVLHPHATLCIATNASLSTEADIRRALARGGLDAFITHVFCRASLGVGKDQPAFWRTIAERLRLPPARILMVGDNPAQDVVAPRRSGLQALLVGNDSACDACLPSLRHLPDLVLPMLYPA